MKSKILKRTTLAIFLLLLSSCGGGGGNSSAPVVDDTTDNNTDGTTAAKFQDVADIISTNCSSCHGNTPSNGAPMSLTTFSQISFFASSIKSRINKNEDDSTLMPLNGPKLSQEDIDTIESWIAGGKQQN